MNKVLSTIQSRKFWATILVIATAVSLFMTGHIDIDKMLDTIRWIASFYISGLSFEDGLKKLLPALKALLKD